MRRFIIASHHKFADGLKKTLEFLSDRDNIYAVSAYVDDVPVEEQIKKVFAKFNADDEVIIMTDMLQGSVNQKFYPYINNHVHLICGINVPCAMSFVMQPDEKFTSKSINEIINYARSQIIYVNDYRDGQNEDDE